MYGAPTGLDLFREEEQMHINSMVMYYPSQDLPDSYPREGGRESEPESQGPKQGWDRGRGSGEVGVCAIPGLAD